MDNQAGQIACTNLEAVGVEHFQESSMDAPAVVAVAA